MPPRKRVVSFVGDDKPTDAASSSTEGVVVVPPAAGGGSAFQPADAASSSAHHDAPTTSVSDMDVKAVVAAKGRRKGGAAAGRKRSRSTGRTSATSGVDTVTTTSGDTSGAEDDEANPPPATMTPPPCAVAVAPLSVVVTDASVPDRVKEEEAVILCAAAAQHEALPDEGGTQQQQTTESVAAEEAQVVEGEEKNVEDGGGSVEAAATTEGSPRRNITMMTLPATPSAASTFARQLKEGTLENGGLNDDEGRRRTPWMGVGSRWVPHGPALIARFQSLAATPEVRSWCEALLVHSGLLDDDGGSAPAGSMVPAPNNAADVIHPTVIDDDSTASSARRRRVIHEELLRWALLNAIPIVNPNRRPLPPSAWHEADEHDADPPHPQNRHLLSFVAPCCSAAPLTSSVASTSWLSPRLSPRPLGAAAGAVRMVSCPILPPSPTAADSLPVDGGGSEGGGDDEAIGCENDVDDDNDNKRRMRCWCNQTAELVEAWLTSHDAIGSGETPAAADKHHADSTAVLGEESSVADTVDSADDDADGGERSAATPLTEEGDRDRLGAIRRLARRAVDWTLAPPSPSTATDAVPVDRRPVMVFRRALFNVLHEPGCPFRTLSLCGGAAPPAMRAASEATAVPQDERSRRRCRIADAAKKGIIDPLDAALTLLATHVALDRIIDAISTARDPTASTVEAACVSDAHRVMVGDCDHRLHRSTALAHLLRSLMDLGEPTSEVATSRNANGPDDDDTTAATTPLCAWSTWGKRRHSPNEESGGGSLPMVRLPRLRVTRPPNLLVATPCNEVSVTTTTTTSEGGGPPSLLCATTTAANRLKSSWDGYMKKRSSLLSQALLVAKGHLRATSNDQPSDAISIEHDVATAVQTPTLVRTHAMTKRSRGWEDDIATARDDDDDDAIAGTPSSPLVPGNDPSATTKTVESMRRRSVFIMTTPSQFFSCLRPKGEEDDEPIPTGGNGGQWCSACRRLPGEAVVSGIVQVLASPIPTTRVGRFRSAQNQHPHDNSSIRSVLPGQPNNNNSLRTQAANASTALAGMPSLSNFLLDGTTDGSHPAADSSVLEETWISLAIGPLDIPQGVAKGAAGPPRRRQEQRRVVTLTKDVHLPAPPPSLVVSSSENATSVTATPSPTEVWLPYSWSQYLRTASHALEQRCLLGESSPPPDGQETPPPSSKLFHLASKGYAILAMPPPPPAVVGTTKLLPPSLPTTGGTRVPLRPQPQTTPAAQNNITIGGSSSQQRTPPGAATTTTSTRGVQQVQAPPSHPGGRSSSVSHNVPLQPAATHHQPSPYDQPLHRWSTTPQQPLPPHHAALFTAPSPSQSHNSGSIHHSSGGGGGGAAGLFATPPQQAAMHGAALGVGVHPQDAAAMMRMMATMQHHHPSSISSSSPSHGGGTAMFFGGGQPHHLFQQQAGTTLSTHQQAAPPFFQNLPGGGYSFGGWPLGMESSGGMGVLETQPSPPTSGLLQPPRNSQVNPVHNGNNNMRSAGLGVIAAPATAAQKTPKMAAVNAQKMVVVGAITSPNRTASSVSPTAPLRTVPPPTTSTAQRGSSNAEVTAAAVGGGVVAPPVAAVALSQRAQRFAAPPVDSPSLVANKGAVPAVGSSPQSVATSTPAPARTAGIAGNVPPAARQPVKEPAVAPPGKPVGKSLAPGKVPPTAAPSKKAPQPAPGKRAVKQVVPTATPPGRTVRKS